ncbi:hypothetical protein JOC95_000681 [Bacillus tianshenii]|uniref:Uncharacterized protein n=1 Tax=Sutcliffiella tianshenii TaxID=1463404 RepID=A0ABS2NW00_9BACI|nr:hypothetical protein [Bacillus tianshenii]MBM7618839.1 hypothetical protein [Bacillus tianshenii]
MKKLSRGAFSMVLAGAVTFSVTNALLVEHIAGDHALNIFGKDLKADVISELKEKNQTQATNGEVGQNNQKPSDTTAAPQTASKNDDVAVADTQKENPTNEVEANPTKKNVSTSDATVTSTNAPTKTPAATTEPRVTGEPPVTTTPPVKTAQPVTAKPAEPAKPVQTTIPKTTGNSTNNAATTITNNGQDVSQAAKEKAETRQENKENNGKKM